MSINLIISTDSLNAPLTGIGYYTAHLVDEFLKRGEFERIRGLSHAGIQAEEDLHQLLRQLTQGELGRGVTDPSQPGVATDAPATPRSEVRRGEMRQHLKEAAKKVPGAYTVARHWYAYRHKAALKKEIAREKGVRWLVHGPNYIQPQHDGQSVITIHDLSHLRYPETHPGERIEWLNRYLPAAIDRAEKIICVSEFTREELIDLELISDPARAVVCHNGIDPSFRQRSRAEIGDELEKWGLTHRGYIMSAATMEPRKNLGRLLDAYEALPLPVASRFPLVLAGAAGWKNSELRQRIARIKPPRHVITTGYLPREALQKLICGAAAFAYLSFYEGFGLPVLEAMASGTPVITANSTSLREVAADSGYTVDPLDVDAIAHGLTRLLEDNQLAALLTEKGLARAATFSWERCARETVDVYKQVIAHQPTVNLQP